MRSDTREEISAALDAYHASLSRVLDLKCDALTTPELLACLQRLEVERRRQGAAEHALINQLAGQACEEELGGTLRTALANRLHITPGEASRRIAEAEDLGERRALTGEPLPAQLTATAAAQREGKIGREHIKEIQAFFKELSAAVDLGIREAAEAQLAELATSRRPDHLHGLATQLMDWLHPDGNFSDQERARKRGITMGKQEFDGMSRISGLLTPELRATIEAVLAKLAAPGACNPDDQTPVVDDTPDADAVRRDTRSQAQRHHDGLLAGLRGLLASGELGQHRGLPVTVVVSTTLKELEAATGKGVTGGGSRVPMSDLIRMASHANHYLALFDGAKPLALYHTKRLASPAQRIMLYAKDRGCSRPGCDAPAYHSEVHHVTPWTTNHRTDINDLTLACGPDNRLVEKGWKTRKNAHGDTEWLPPPHLDHGQPRINRYHHPAKILCEQDDDEPH
ncbi:HNH endonuclease signature motif containing protein [Mycobacterium tuberculosis]|uniref:HNH endonuclease signature motif containing protein n=1 Tax=Mycobacterium tuberculosis TaxID=1773 RepID=UPI0004B50DAB|nr:HNH endonuclease signature motif containing protein [Mycobacterium tuberculosis]